MDQVHSSRDALARARAGIGSFSLAMIAADESTRGDLARACRDADNAFEQRKREKRTAEAELRDAQRRLREAEVRRASAEAELSSAQTAAAAANPHSAAAAEARIGRAQSDVGSARAEESQCGEAVSQARSALDRAVQAQERCTAARNRIHQASARYRSAAVSYVAASSAIVAAGRLKLGRLSTLLDTYLAIDTYHGAAPGAIPGSPSSGSSQGARSSDQRSPSSTPAWANAFDVSLIPLREITAVPSDACSALDRWDIERFENAVEQVLNREDWESRLKCSDERNGRHGERTLLGVVERMLRQPVTLSDSPPRRVVSGTGLVAAAQRAGMTHIPARVKEAQ